MSLFVVEIAARVERVGDVGAEACGSAGSFATAFGSGPLPGPRVALTYHLPTGRRTCGRMVGVMARYDRACAGGVGDDGADERFRGRRGSRDRVAFEGIRSCG